MHKYKLNEKYFDVLDTPEKAYILGFIFADGGIARVRGVSYRLDFSQHANGREVLEFIRKQLQYTGPILYDQPNNLGGTIFLRDRLQICSKYLAESLEQYGILPNKSLTLGAPKKLPKQFVGSFLRGLFDGDGSVGMYLVNRTSAYMGSEYGAISFNGTHTLLTWVAKKLHIGHKLYPHVKINRLQICKQSDLLRTIDVFGSSPFGMKRKNLVLLKLAAWLEQSPKKTRISKNTLKSKGQLSKRQAKKRSRD